MERLRPDRPFPISPASAGSSVRSNEPCVVAAAEQAPDRLDLRRIRLLATREHDRSCRDAQRSGPYAARADAEDERRRHNAPGKAIETADQTSQIQEW